MSTRTEFGGIALEQADHKLFTAFFSVYDDTVRFRRGWDVPLHSVPEGAPCYWILEGERRIGGALLGPNRIGPFFVIPPYRLSAAMLQAMLTFARSVSNDAEPIRGLGILEHQAAAMEAAGFRRALTRRGMMRPTEPLPDPFAAGWNVRRPTAADADALGALLYASYAQGTGDVVDDTLEETQEEVGRFLSAFDGDPSLEAASTVVVDPRTGAAAGVCLIGRVEGWPFVAHVAVLPQYRGFGLASAMIRHAISALHASDPMLLLFVTVGNGAETVYEKLGFLAGPSVTRMTLSDA